MQIVIGATQKETAIDQQQHSCEILICQHCQTILRLFSSAATASTRWRVHELNCPNTYASPSGSNSTSREYLVGLPDVMKTWRCFEIPTNCWLNNSASYLRRVGSANIHIFLMCKYFYWRGHYAGNKLLWNRWLYQCTLHLTILLSSWALLWELHAWETVAVNVGNSSVLF